MENVKSLVDVAVNCGSPKSKFRSLIEYAAEAKKPIRIIQKMEVAMPSIRIGTFMAVLLYEKRNSYLEGLVSCCCSISSKGMTINSGSAGLASGFAFSSTFSFGFCGWDCGFC